ncbi:amidohydrolase family protein [Massilia sp. PAMC28688]|uniref:amidohydrolase family protein n=1 Tax=Massilia sp. PAMC28688 TaxID=2861283 RepID=UPI001C6349CF|nr:amidohydrolase family protein [Massilia sp. PAMC28688]QYF92386.1 amidohydrolase family protein [Massilia sp. PAMC28688]
MRRCLTQWTILAALAASMAPVLAQAANAPAPLADHHQHLFSPAIVAVVGLPPGSPSYLGAADIVGLLDQAGTRRAAVLSVAYMYGSPKRKIENEYDKVKAENDWTLSETEKFPGRLKAMCGVNPLKDYALAELARCAGEARFGRAIKLHFGNSDVEVDKPEHMAKLKQFFSAANGHGMGLIVHMRASISLKRPYGADQARVFLEQLMPLVPDVPVQLAHMAGTGPGYDDPPSDAAMAVMADAAAARDPRTRNLWFDVASVADAEIAPAHAAKLVERIRRAGVGRILYGTDAAVGTNLRPRQSWEAFSKLPLTPAELRTIATNVAPYLRQD